MSSEHKDLSTINSWEEFKNQNKVFYIHDVIHKFPEHRYELIEINSEYKIEDILRASLNIFKNYQEEKELLNDLGYSDEDILIKLVMSTYLFRDKFATYLVLHNPGLIKKIDLKILIKVIHVDYLLENADLDFFNQDMLINIKDFDKYKYLHDIDNQYRINLLDIFLIHNDYKFAEKFKGHFDVNVALIHSIRKCYNCKNLLNMGADLRNFKAKSGPCDEFSEASFDEFKDMLICLFEKLDPNDLCQFFLPFFEKKNSGNLDGGHGMILTSYLIKYGWEKEVNQVLGIF